MSRRWLVPGLLLGLAIVGAAASAPLPAVTTVLTVKGGVGALALDGTRIAWFPSGTTCTGRLHVLDAVTRHDSSVKLRQGRCESTASLHNRMAFARNQVLFGLDYAGNLESDVDLLVADARKGTVRRVGIVGIAGGHDANDPHVPVPISGAGGLLAFGDFSASSGSLADRIVYRVDGAKKLPLPATYGVTALAADAGRVAVARALPAGCVCNAAARVSRDGTRIAFVSGQWPGGSATTGQRSVYVVNSDGTGLQRLGKPGQIARDPVWSPDGSAVAYTAGGIHRIVVEVPGGVRTDLGEGDTPSWSPDGKRLVFIADDPKTSSNYAVIENRDGTGRRLVVKADTVGWSPAGNRLVIGGFIGGANGVALVGTDGKNMVMLPRRALYPTWSPDGTRVAYKGTSDFRALFVTQVKGGAVTRIAVGHGGDPRWSPDGLHLAYDVIDSTSSGPSETWTRTVWVTPADGSSPPVKVAPGSEPDWLQDGKLVFTRPLAQLSDTEIATVALDGTDVRNVATTQPAPAQAFVEVRSASGKLLSRAPTDATAVLLSGPLLVDRTAKGLEVRNASTGALVRKLPSPSGAGAMVLAGRWLAYELGRSVRLLDTRTGKNRVLATTSGPVVGLSASGNRIAWAESGTSSRIRTILLPR